MKKKKELSVTVGIFLFAVAIFFSLNAGSVLAVDSVSLRITGVIGNYGSQVTLRTDKNANIGLDAYDMPAPSAPSGYSSFYSSINSGSLAIDSWDEREREIELVYDVPEEESGSVTFSWNRVTGTNYKAYFSITGLISNLDMSSTSSYSYSVSNDSDIYVTISIQDYPASPTPQSPGSPSSPGGGGGIAPQQPDINITLRGDGKILFDAEIFVTDRFRAIMQGEKMQSTINLVPMGKNPYLDVTLNYIIRYADGRETGIKQSKTILVTEQKSILETFNTDTLFPGNYILELELIYETEPGKTAVATASSHFSVKKEGEGILPGNYKIILGVLAFGIILLIILIIFINRGYRKIRKSGKR